MAVRGVDHVGIAVATRSEAEAWARSLGLRITREERVQDQGVDTLFVDLPNMKLEFIVPFDDTGPVARHLRTRGPGLHHLALEVDDVTASVADVQRAGIRPIDEVPRGGVEGTRIAFLHPKDTQKVLVELVQRPTSELP